MTIQKLRNKLRFLTDKHQLENPQVVTILLRLNLTGVEIADLISYTTMTISHIKQKRLDVPSRTVHKFRFFAMESHEYYGSKKFESDLD